MALSSKGNSGSSIPSLRRSAADEAVRPGGAHQVLAEVGVRDADEDERAVGERLPLERGGTR
jgi:hypothetical protein